MSETESDFDHRLVAYLPLTPAVFHILLVLADGAKHGYAVMKEVAEQTDGELRLGPGKLYYSIQRLLDEELIEELEPSPGSRPGRGRRTYELTVTGRDLLRAEAQRLQKAVRLAQQRHVLATLGNEAER